ncbi:MAG: ribonuclease III [Clostridia bacterium]|nr:ribonuclease III [Clostridia bacterium]
MDNSQYLANLPSPLALAYLGDARHALFIRRLLVSRGLSRSGELNREALKYVTAEAQAEAYLRIEDRLNEDERAMFGYASNSTHLNKPKHASGKEYRTATGFEAVIGMLDYLGNQDRIDELLTLAHSE